MEVEAHGNHAVIDDAWCAQEYRRLCKLRKRRRQQAARDERWASRYVLYRGDECLPVRKAPRWSSSSEEEEVTAMETSDSSVSIADNALTRAKVDELEVTSRILS